MTGESMIARLKARPSFLFNFSTLMKENNHDSGLEFKGG